MRGNILHQILGSVERTAPLAIGCRHESLECFAEDLGIDRRLGPVCRVFTSAEAVVREKGAESVSERFVGEQGAASLLLQMRPGEEPAIEKWNSPELSRSHRARTHGCVERSEEKRLQDSLLVSPAFGDATRVSIAQKTEVAIEPTSGLEKRQEYESRDVEQRELVPLRPAHSATQGIGELRDDALKSGEKAPRDCFAP